ncbi:MAG TPA: tyrosine-type recombinase/integrase [Gemmatimonadales bacterium]|nr:tyrosine-type recombinase/integrase [Gemmatimonadales bacterium]
MPAVGYRRFEREILDLYAPPHRRLSTFKKMRTVLGEFRSLRRKRSRQPMVQRTSDILPSAILRWLEVHEDREPITNLSYLNTFRAAVNIAVKMKWVRVSPWAIRSDWITFDDADLEEIERKARHFSIPELLKILDQADAEALLGGREAALRQALVYTYAYTGMRKMEALGLRVDDVRLADEVIMLRSHRLRRLKTKASGRPLGIAPELKVVLERWIPQCGSEWLFPGKRRVGPWFNGSVGQKPLDQVKALCLRAGVADGTIQKFRHSLATHAKRLGMGPYEVKDLLRHTNERTQEWYLEDDLINCRAAAQRISFRQFAPSAQLNAG